MMKKTIKSKHFVCFIFETSKTLMVKIQYVTKNFEKITEINNKAVKKITTAQLHQGSCEKSRHTQHHGAFVFTQLLSLWS